MQCSSAMRPLAASYVRRRLARPACKQLGSTMTAVPYEAGNLPSQSSYIHREATCPGECTSDFSSTITVFAALHHMHYYGHKFITEKYDASGGYVGVAGPRIDFWDNGFQQIQPTNYTVAPGASARSAALVWQPISP